MSMSDETITADSPVTFIEPDVGKRLLEGTALCLSGGGYRAMLFHLGSLWGIRTDTANYGLADVLPCPHEQSLALANLRTRLKRYRGERSATGHQLGLCRMRRRTAEAC
jgi:hypothetical protein